MRYMIVKETNNFITKHPSSAINLVEERVNGYIKNGWKPIGGVSVITYGTNNTTTACQAMVKD